MLIRYLIVTILFSIIHSISIFAESNRCRLVKACYIVFYNNEKYHKLDRHDFGIYGVRSGVRFIYPNDGVGEYFEVKGFKRHSFLKDGDKIYRIDECRPKNDPGGVVGCGKGKADEHDYPKRYYLFSAPLEYIVKHIREVEIERNGTRIIIQTEKVLEEKKVKDRELEIQNRNILRKIFFFWEWGDYF